MWEQPISAVEFEYSRKTIFGRLRYGPEYLMIWNSSIRKVIALGEAKRSGVLVGIALERYRRDLGVWPDSLNELQPDYLAEVPVDPITGEPARYQIIDGWPMVYSVGGDRDDDEGRLPVSRGWHSEEEYENLSSAQTWDIKNAGDGDWVLYPYADTLRYSEPEKELPEDSDPYGYGGYIADEEVKASEVAAPSAP